MAVSQATLRSQVITLLNENTNTSIGNQETGTGGGATVATNTTIDQFLDEGASRICRSFYPLPGKGTIDVNGKRIVSLRSVSAWIEPGSSSDGSTLHCCYDIVIGGVLLKGDSFMASKLSATNYLTAIGTPAKWHEISSESIGLVPTASTSTTATIYGFVVPPSITASPNTASWIPDDLASLLVIYAAARIVQKNADDSTLYARLKDHATHFDAMARLIYEKMEDDLKVSFYPTPPLSLFGMVTAAAQQ